MTKSTNTHDFSKEGLSEKGGRVAVVGGGPAGLRAAEVAASFGAQVQLFEANPYVGRKFLVAGKGGLNLTHGEELLNFAGRYRSRDDAQEKSRTKDYAFWKSLLLDFGPDALRAWAADLGVETFQASTGRIYPRELKAAPLLRQWIRRLNALGVALHTRHFFASLQPGPPFHLSFEEPGGQNRRSLEVDAVILALGGASWPKTGSNGRWVPFLKGLGLEVSPLEPANCGWECEWPEGVLRECEGRPLKNVCASTADHSLRGEILVTRYGLEGGAIYGLSHVLRQQSPPRLWIDFKPDSSPESLLRRLGSAKTNFFEEACNRWRLDAATRALLRHTHPQITSGSAQDTVSAVKRFPVVLSGPRPIGEAISSAGGIALKEVNSSLMSLKFPGLFFAGEMLDWEAPTGGYLLQGCFATATRSGAAAARWALESR